MVDPGRKMPEKGANIKKDSRCSKCVERRTGKNGVILPMANWDGRYVQQSISLALPSPMPQRERYRKAKKAARIAKKAAGGEGGGEEGGEDDKR